MTSDSTLPEPFFTEPSESLTLTIVVHPTIERLGEQIHLPGRRAAVSRLEPLFPGGDLSSRTLPRMPFHILPDGDGVRLVVPDGGPRLLVADRPVRGSRKVEAAELDAGIVLSPTPTVALLLRSGHPQAPDELGLTGGSPAWGRLRQRLQILAKEQLPLLIRGGSGAGKSLIAETLHRIGPTPEGPFRVLHLPAFRRDELRAALQAEDGFAGAAGGTLVFEEIEEAEPEAWAILRAALDTMQSTATDRCAIDPTFSPPRMLTLSCQPPSESPAEGGLPTGLLHRLAGIELRIPSLGGRPEDVAMLLRRAARHRAADPDTSDNLDALLPPTLQRQALAWSWPGGVRELRSWVEAVIADGRAGLPAPAPGSQGSPRGRTSEAETDLVQRLETAIDARIGQAELTVATLARQLGMSPRTLQRETQRLWGRSPNDLILERRLVHARNLLRAGARTTVGEIATMVGLSRSYLTRAYTLHFGVSPTADLGSLA